MINLKYSSVKHLVVQADVGCSVMDCIKEGLIIALENDFDVIVLHNGNQYPISPSGYVNKIYNKTK